MRLGLALDLGRDDFGLDILIEKYSGLLRSAAHQDFHSVWLGETYGQPGDTSGHISSPMLGLAALAWSTPALLGVGVTLLPAWHPLRLAYDGAVLDALTGGRLIIGTGVGRKGLWDRFGVDAGDVAGYVDDTLRGVRHLWSGGGSYEGDAMAIEGGIAPVPARPGGPPFWVGGKSRAAIRRAADVGEAYFAGSSTSLNEMSILIDAYRDRLATPEQSQSGYVAVNRIAIVADSREEANALAGAHLRLWHSSYHDRGLTETGFEEARSDLMLLGNADDVAEMLASYGEIGIDQVNLRIAPIGLPLEIAAATLERICESALVRERSS
jgi:alkanesulfonate monooxygenase SsuD/methylene tetrahydromethanopterin reductase-like flavin-dependent oxidoreductase (luciferase family)